MCRHLGYIGPPVTLAELLIDPPHGLLHQAVAPREQEPGTVNADGFGVGWYNGGEPSRYRRAEPIWTDPALPRIARTTTTSCTVAAVRSATPGMPIEPAATAPFTAGRFLFSHNGAVAAWPLAERLLSEQLPVGVPVESATDSALLWGLLLARLRDGQQLAKAVAELMSQVLAVADGRLNLLASDGDSLVATRYGNTLYARQLPAGAVVASEPLDDDPAWSAIPDHSLVVAGHTRLDVQPLALGGAS
jgi:glutamine amidotransferase